MKKCFYILSLTIGILVCATVLVSCSSDNEKPEKEEQPSPLEGETFSSEDGCFSYTFINGGKELELKRVNHSGYIPEVGEYKGKNFPVTRIGNYACGEDTYISEIPEGIVSIGVGAFKYNTHWYIKLPSTLRIIEKEAFAFNKYLGKVDISNGITVIPNSAFAFCEKLESINIPESVKNIEEYAFNGCSNLANITIPNSVISIGVYAFYDCGLYSITIPGSVTTIGKGAFEGCQLKSLTLLEGVETIEEGAFANCKELSEVSLPNSLKIIGDIAFLSCKRLISITIPENVTSIGVAAFSDKQTSQGGKTISGEDCLKKVISLIDNPFPIDRAFGHNFNNYGILYVPKGTSEKYKSTEGWKEIQTIIEQ